MDLEINKKAYKKKNFNPLHISIGFLVFSILLTGGLYIYNMTLITSNTDLIDNINSRETSISNLEKNPKIVASSLYNANLSSINTLEDRSKISFYIKHLMKLRREYNIDFKGFKYSGGKLTTQAIASTDGYGINYKKVVRFIEEYRKNKDLSSLFDLELVKNVSSKDSGALNVFTINLSLKNNISNIFKKAEEKKSELNKIKAKRAEEERIKKEIKAKKILEKIKEAKLKKQQSNSGSTNTGTIVE